MVVGVCNPSYSGGWGRKITWTQEGEIAVSWDRATALQPEQQRETLSQNKNKNKQKLQTHTQNSVIQCQFPSFDTRFYGWSGFMQFLI